MTHVHRIARRPGRTAPWPRWVPPDLVDRLRSRGVDSLWEHQARAADLAYGGSSVIVATGTASGKSLAYLLPVLSTLLLDESATALYLAPTKALAADQLRAVRDLDLAGVRPAAYDGDTPPAERAWARAHSRLVFTNPDMLHRGILPGHERWRSFLRRLRYVIVDECHVYRGVFGSHVAHVLRRLDRVRERYGASPVYALASATVARPAELGAALTGRPVEAVVEDGSPRGAATFALWEPPFTDESGERGAPVRRGVISEAARVFAGLVADGARTLVFVRSRWAAETVALTARRSLAESAPGMVDRVAAYRGGYLPEDRRALERALMSGALSGLATTNALELGVDIAGLDAVVLAGYPGSLASLWQQSGRAGRDGRESLVVFVARDDPLDTYLAHHPEAIFGRPVEAAVLDPANPYVLSPHLCAAAAELPLTEADLDRFGGRVTREPLADLTERRSLRRRPTGWYWVGRDRPTTDLRGGGGDPVTVVEAATGRLLGTVDVGAAHLMVHRGAVYLHQGDSYVVDELDLDNACALVHAEDPEWSTTAREVTDVRVVEHADVREAGGVRLCLGSVEVTSQVVSYLRRWKLTGGVFDEVPLDLPARQLRTRAVWYVVDEAVLAGAGLEPTDIAGAAHAAEHAAIGMLPLFATCDRRDIGGLAAAKHPDTGLCTVFVYDGHPGGAGFAARGFGAVDRWLAATRDAILSCECDAGCPSCIQSPKCGDGNEPLDKAGSARLLSAVLAALTSH